MLGLLTSSRTQEEVFLPSHSGTKRCPALSNHLQISVRNLTFGLALLHTYTSVVEHRSLSSVAITSCLRTACSEQELMVFHFGAIFEGLPANPFASLLEVLQHLESVESFSEHTCFVLGMHILGWSNEHEMK